VVTVTEPNRQPDEELRDYRDTMRQIANHTPTCSTESEEAWSQRLWASLFRDLQRMARDSLRRHGQL
jgi:hypothetical protein